MNEGAIRAFIAIELPEELKDSLRRLQARMRQESRCPAKWVDSSGIHLTLKFLGNIPESGIDDIVRAMQAAASGIPPFTLEMKGLGVFPNPRKVQVIWAGIGGDTENLHRLQKGLENNLSGLGFPPESRPFSPHLTLARVRNEASPQERQDLGSHVCNLVPEERVNFTVNSVNLMQSRLTPQGAVYRRVAEAKLK